MQVFIIQQWVDEFLQWDPTKYNNISTIFVERSKIWTVDIGSKDMLGP